MADRGWVLLSDLVGRKLTGSRQDIIQRVLRPADLSRHYMPDRSRNGGNAERHQQREESGKCLYQLRLAQPRNHRWVGSYFPPLRPQVELLMHWLAAGT
eukprot:1912983-Pyramimonas_sp.AAC.1